MLGSCCEEQEAQEAAVRSRIRAATLASEKRLLGRSLAAARSQSFCAEACCSPVVCQGCSEDASEEDEDDPAKSDPRMAHDTDEDEAELLRRIRATRLAQLQTAAEKSVRPAVGYEYTEEQTLLLLQNDATAPPAVCLVGMEDDTELSAWLDDHLTTVAPRYPPARFMRVQDCPTLLGELSFVRSLPVLLLLHRGIVLAFDQGLGEEREPDHLRARIDHWLHEHSAKLVQPAPNINSDSEDEEGDGSSYCGRAGCRDYPHEHVSWAKKQPEKRVVPRELKRV